jgi:hypothetical protein
MRRWTGWTAFAAWSAASALLVFSIVAGFGIGLFVFPVAVIAIFVVAFRSSGWPEVVGVIAGAGAVLLFIAFLNRDYDPCPESGFLDVPPGETSAECGGLDPMPWLISGAVLVAVAFVAHAIFRRW